MLSFEQKKTARLSSLAFLFPFFSLLSSLRLCARACAPRLIYRCYELWLSSVQVLAARNTAHQLEHIAFCCAFLFPFARGFIAARCLSAFDSRYRSWFGPPSLVARLLSPDPSRDRTSTLKPRADLTHIFQLATRRHAPSISLRYTSDVYILLFVAALSTNTSPNRARL